MQRSISSTFLEVWSLLRDQLENLIDMNLQVSAAAFISTGLSFWILGQMWFCYYVLLNILCIRMWHLNFSWEPTANRHCCCGREGSRLQSASMSKIMSE